MLAVCVHLRLLQVTSIRVQGDERENLRRIQAETRRQERRQKLLYEAESRWRTAQPAYCRPSLRLLPRPCPDAISENFTQSLAPLAGAKLWRVASQCLGGARLCGVQR